MVVQGIGLLLDLVDLYVGDHAQDHDKNKQYRVTQHELCSDFQVLQGHNVFFTDMDGSGFFIAPALKYCRLGKNFPVVVSC